MHQPITVLIQNKKNVYHALRFNCCFSSTAELWKIIVQRSYGHSEQLTIEQLTTTDHLTNDQI